MSQTDVSTALSRARRPVTSPPYDEDFLPTEEELVIMRLVADGLPLNSVARHAAMSSRTVRRRLRRLCDQLSVAQPIEAIVWAARRGLI